MIPPAHPGRFCSQGGAPQGEKQFEIRRIPLTRAPALMGQRNIITRERLTDLIEKAKPILQAAMPAEPSGLFHLLQPVTTEDRPPESQKA
jgi:hypothetical protein